MSRFDYDSSTRAPEVQAVVRRYRAAVAEDPEAQAFLAEHPEFAPGVDPNDYRKSLQRNWAGSRLLTYLLDPFNLSRGNGEVEDLSRRRGEDRASADPEAIRHQRFKPLSLDRPTEEEALENLEPEVDQRAALVDLMCESMESLKESHRQLIDWEFYKKLSRTDMADRLNVEASTVSRNLEVAMWALKEAIARMEGPLPTIPTGGRPKKDRAAIHLQFIRVMRSRGLPPPDCEENLS